jgi:hypothetical protein
MSTTSVPPTTSSSVPAAAEAPLRGGWLLMARTVWLAIAIFCLMVFIVGIPLNYANLGKVCTLQPCDQDPTPDSIARFHTSGLSLSFYASYIGTLAVVSGLAVSRDRRADLLAQV